MQTTDREFSNQNYVISGEECSLDVIDGGISIVKA